MDKQDEKRVREIAREEALKCVRKELAEWPAYYPRDEPKTSKHKKI